MNRDTEKFKNLVQLYGHLDLEETLTLLHYGVQDTARMNRLEEFLAAGSVQIEPDTPIRQRLDEAGTHLEGVKHLVRKKEDL